MGTASVRVAASRSASRHANVGTIRRLRNIDPNCLLRRCRLVVLPQPGSQPRRLHPSDWVFFRIVRLPSIVDLEPDCTLSHRTVIFTCLLMGKPGGFCDASPGKRNTAWAMDITTRRPFPALHLCRKPSTYALLFSGIDVFFITRKQLLHS
jgi:hypothetical protein